MLVTETISRLDLVFLSEEMDPDPTRLIPYPEPVCFKSCPDPVLLRPNTDYVRFSNRIHILSSQKTVSVKCL